MKISIIEQLSGRGDYPHLVEQSLLELPEKFLKRNKRKKRDKVDNISKLHLIFFSLQENFFHNIPKTQTSPWIPREFAENVEYILFQPQEKTCVTS